MNKQIDPPQFLVIGAQKAGTTWLYKQLSNHPDVFIPPVKEVHYFDRDESYSSPSRLALASVQDRINSDSNPAKEWKKYLFHHIKNQEREDIFQSKWYLNYLFGYYDDEWYKSLFVNTKDKINGDITPAYSLLKTSDIEKIKQMFPQIKIIFSMRNPIDRDWSHFRYDCQLRNVKPSTIAKKHILEFMNHEGVRERGNYVKIIEKWTKVFSKEQILICYYDDIKIQPRNLLNSIFSFLNINCSNQDFTDKMMSKKFNKSFNADIPSEIENQLLELHIYQLENLSQMLGSYTTEWLLDSKNKLNSQRSNSCQKA